MRAIALGLTATLFASTSLPAAELSPASRITGVMVFPAGAEVTRLATVRLEPGEHTLLFPDLPAQAVAGSIRVEGRSTGRLEIGSVDTRRTAVPRADPTQLASERRAIEAEIESLRDQKAVIESEVKAAAQQLALIEKLTALPGQPSPFHPQGGTVQPDWGQLLVLIGQRSAEAQKVSLAAQVRMRENDRRVEELKKKLAAIAPNQEERTEVKVAVAAGAVLEAEVVVRYQVAGASWVPYYDARLTTGTREVAPKLTLVRRASIQQRSGEDWKDIALQLSTTRPGAGTSAPELSPMTVDFEPDAPPRPVARSMAPAAPVAGVVSSDDRPPEARQEIAARPKLAEAVEQKATIEAAPFQAVFVVPGKLTILATGEQKRVQIDDATIEPQLIVRTVPRLDAKAYLYAKLIMPKTTAYLPGQVLLFRDGTFVGNGRLPQLAAGEDHELGFGQDDAVRVRHAVIDEKKSEQGIFTSNKAEQRNFRITLRNLHERPISVVLLDQVPTSQNQDIKVDLITKQPPTRRDIDDKRGVMAWDLKLEPQQEQAIEFGWRVQWPAAKKIQYGR
jgi:uncharacterized protein (TIGR02231 family)